MLSIELGQRPQCPTDASAQNIRNTNLAKHIGHTTKTLDKGLSSTTLATVDHA